MTREEAKKEILEKVKERFPLLHPPVRFIPGQTKVHYAGRVYDDREIINLVDSALEFWLTAGPWGEKFERRMKEFFGAGDFLLVNSGSSANLVAVSTLVSDQVDGHLEKGDEVITPAVTFPTTLTPILQNGLIPVFVDCEVGTYNINPALVEEAISPKTRAMVIPHTLGNPCDMSVITALAEKYRLFLIEDCCDALGATFCGKLVGTFGHMASLSFFPAHHITTGEGGGVIVNRPRLGRVAESIRDWGRNCWCAPGFSNTCGKRFGWQQGDLPFGYDHKYIFTSLGYNLKATEMQAAIGLAQLDKLDGFIKRRRKNFARYYEALRTYEDFLVLPKADPRANPSWFAFPLTVRPPIERTQLIRWLEDAKIETRLVFGGNILRQPAFRNISCRMHRALEKTDVIMRDTFFIGVYPGLTDEMIDFVIERFREFFRRL
jgi:CDP-6-deoxy-D-xylo-4-hexulose-3-dehydrase